MDDPQHYRSLLAGILDQPMCLIWCAGIGVDEVLSEVGGQSHTVVRRSFRQTSEAAYDAMPQQAGAVLAGRLGDWVLAIEPNGFQGSRLNVLANLSRDGRALSVFWNASGDAQIAYAEQGRVLATVDPFDPEGVEGEEPERLTAWIEALPFDDDWKVAALAMGELLTGQRLGNDWLTADHLSALTVVVPDSDTPAPTDERREFIRMRDELLLREPRLAELFADPTPDRLREVAILTAETACAQTGLAGPLIDEAFAALNTWRADTPAWRIREALEELQHDLLTQVSAALPTAPVDADGLQRQVFAANVLLAALNEDAFTAAMDTIWRIGMIWLDSENNIRLSILRHSYEEMKKRV
ncbi:DUF6461 domain-containing protein [Streptosporangium sp. NPDC000563]|uniref:DUF6461 domain-containing protein n=1 Tax=Streptosporangium sp. NPDC000563 TaxID=3154366 RepID=UPI003331C724